MSLPKIVLSRYECAQLLGISIRLLDKCIANGDIKAIRLGDRVLIPRAELERFTAQVGRPNSRRSQP
jgi:excisionase family DNA binding protein